MMSALRTPILKELQRSPITSTNFSSVSAKSGPVNAATGHTAAELIAERADATQPNMGLTVWKGEVVRQGDVTIAKNYLREDEIDELNRIVVMWLDFAFDQAKRRKQIFLQDWQTKLDEFLKFNDRNVLIHAGKRTKKDADEAAHNQYEQFTERCRIVMEEQGASESIKTLESLTKEDKQP